MRQLAEEAMQDAIPQTNQNVLAVAVEIDRIVGEDDYFTSRNLVINADLYLCLVLVAM